MPMTSTQICNLALAALSQTLIGSLNDQSANARQCNLVYHPARKATLRANAWPFATRIELLNQIAGNVAPATVSIPGWNFLYQYPSQALSILKVYGDLGGMNPLGANDYHSGSGLYTDFDFKHQQSDEFRIIQDPTPNPSNQVIATDVYPAYCEYTADVQNEDLFDSNFLEAFYFKIAAMIAKPLTGDSQLAEAMLKIYDAHINTAIRKAGDQKFQKPFNQSTTVNSR